MKRAVIGLGFGDEGKGLTTNYLAKDAEAVVRFSGGQQAGHMVNFNGIRHVFSNFGSGSLRKLPTYWHKTCTFDPHGTINELEVLEKKGVNLEPLYVHSETPVTTPFDKHANIVRDKELQHGTVGLGVGKTLEREKNFYSLKFEDLFYKNIFTEKLSQIENYYGFSIPEDEYERFLSDVVEVTNNYLIFPFYNNEAIPENVIYEGSQGLMLDPHIGFFPNVTYSNLVPPKNLNEYYLVTRAYTTRHGNGYMPNEEEYFPIKKNPTETNKNDGIQGIFRRRILDVSTLEYAMNKIASVLITGTPKLVITCLDHLYEDYYDFMYNNKRYKYNSVEEFVSKIQELLSDIIDYVYVSFSDESDNIIKFN